MKSFRITMIVLALILLICVFSPGVAQQRATGSPADLAIRNAKVVTIDKENTRAEAIAIKGDKIVAVTTNQAIGQYIQEGTTTVIDAKGRLVIPGFNDAHAHFGPLDPDYIDLRYIADPKIITERVAAKVRELKPGEMIRGGRWEHEMFYNQQWPTKELLDTVAPNNPVALNRADGHSVLVNSYVIKNSGITRETPDPPGGEIQHDPKTGEPTGIFKESAQRLLKYGAVSAARTPAEAQARTTQGMQATLDMAARLGVTSIQLPPGGNLDIYQRFLDNGKLTARIYIGGNLTDNPKQLATYDELRKKYPANSDWIRFGYLKGPIDGTLGSGTALLFEPFADEPDKTGLPPR